MESSFSRHASSRSRSFMRAHSTSSCSRARSSSRGDEGEEGLEALAASEVCCFGKSLAESVDVLLCGNCTVEYTGALDSSVFGEAWRKCSGSPLGKTEADARACGRAGGS
eukprot:3096428-Rhodomonas_salina.1